MKIWGLLMGLFPLSALAHVKWFSNFNYDQPPLLLSQLGSPSFWGLFALSLISLPLLVWTDKLGEKWLPYQKCNHFLDRYSGNGGLIMRVTMGAVLLMAWQSDSIVAPEISSPSPILSWIQFAMALCLIFRETVILTGVGMILLYVVGIDTQGAFHMLDYVVYPAVGLYLILSHMHNEKMKNLDLPVLYSGLGFSLCWVAFEKLIYPYWGLSVLTQAPALAMGLNHEFFLMSCAFIEFTLGYLLMICLLHRPLAVIISLVFFITTSFFGKTEVLGHTILHGALLVFIVKGPGSYYQAPIRFHKSLWLRSVFAMVNFVILFAVLIYPYEKMAQTIYAKSKAEALAHQHPKLDVPKGTPAPALTMEAFKDDMGGFNIHLMTKNFRFTPERLKEPDKVGEGHAHLYVDGEKIGRIYGEWYHLKLSRGTHKLRATLNSNSHRDYFYDGKQVDAEIEVVEDRDVKTMHSN